MQFLTVYDPPNMRIISANLNGIRSAWKKGFAEWLATQNADAVCTQEVRATLKDMAKDGTMENPCGLTGYWHLAERPGYSGVGIWTPHQPTQITQGIGHPDFDAEGRYLELDLGKVTVVSLYLPSGSSSPERQTAKFHFMDEFLPRMKALKDSGREVIICGDWNIAHKEQDLKNWKSNQKNSGFLPEERAWMTQLLDELGWVDVYRAVHPETTSECYTWWSNRGQAYANNVGWRIDYQIATPGIAAKARSASVYKDQKFSDHAPLVIDYDCAL